MSILSRCCLLIPEKVQSYTLHKLLFNYTAKPFISGFKVRHHDSLCGEAQVHVPSKVFVLLLEAFLRERPRGRQCLTPLSHYGISPEGILHPPTISKGPGAQHQSLDFIPI